MKFDNFLGAFLIALFGAVGNMLFVIGQKKTVEVGNTNPFLYPLSNLTVAVIILTVLSYLWFGKIATASYFQLNWLWILLGGIGSGMVYVGFYFLFNQFGASYYTLYAVLAITTTSILAGVIFFKESLNLYYILSIVSAFLTIFFFFMGKK